MKKCFCRLWRGILYNQFFIITSTDSCTFPNRLLQCFLFRIRSLICLLNNTTNTRRRTQSTFSPTEFTIFGTFDQFRTFHPSYMNPLPIKIAATDMRYLARSEFSMSFVHKKNFGFM